MSRLQGGIAVTRFGMGARAGEIEAASSDPRGWLEQQIRPQAAVMTGVEGLDQLQSTGDVFAARMGDVAMSGPSSPGGTAEAQRIIQQRIQREAREGLQREGEARARFGAATAASFAERWVRFWSNHFSVSARNGQMIGLVGPYEREAIRPHVFSSFSKLLGQAVFHPAMLIYLDAARSIGPSTQIARRRGAGLNENLAREILELHTLGVGSGYSQDDIIAFANALTGWTVNEPRMARLMAPGRGPARRGGAASAGWEPGAAVFVDQLHEPGARVLLGQTYADVGREQAVLILQDLAAHPASARHIATKLARHFVADRPPASAVGRLERVFLETHGDLSALARAVVHLDEAWESEQKKLKTPDELLVSAMRAAGPQAVFGSAGGMRTVYTSLAQQPFSAPSPAGWPDQAAAWSGADALMKRIEWADAAARRIAREASPVEFLNLALGDLASARTRQAVLRAESAEQGFTLALMSPEFQRR